MRRTAKDGPKSTTRKIQRAIHLTALGRLLEGDGLLLTHSRDDGDQQVLAIFEASGDLVTHLTLRDFDIVLGGTILSHQVEETVIDVDLRQEDQYLNRENNPKKLTSWYSSRLTLGTSMLWVEGEISSYRQTELS